VLNATACSLLAAPPSKIHSRPVSDLQGRLVLQKFAEDGTPLRRVDDITTEIYKYVPGHEKWVKYEKELSFQQSAGQVPFLGVFGMTVGLCFVIALALIYFVVEMLRQYGQDWLALVAMIVGILLAPLALLKLWEALQTHVMGNVAWDLESRTAAELATVDQALLMAGYGSLALLAAIVAACILPAFFPRPREVIPDPATSMILLDGKLRQYRVWDDSLVVGQRWFAISQAKVSYSGGRPVLTLPDGQTLEFVEVASPFYSGPAARRDEAGELRVDWGRPLTKAMIMVGCIMGWLAMPNLALASDAVDKPVSHLLKFVASRYPDAQTQPDERFGDTTIRCRLT
jgi:hypothetical protein